MSKRISLFCSVALVALGSPLFAAPAAPAAPSTVSSVTSSVWKNSAFVDDRAALLNEQENAELETYLFSLSVPVYVLTLPHYTGDLQRLADAELSARAARGFIIVVSQHPAMWRISKRPTDLLDSLQIEDVGRTQLVRSYRAKQYVKAFKDTARELNRLSLLPTSSPVPEHPVPTNKADTATEATSAIRPIWPSGLPDPLTFVFLSFAVGIAFGVLRLSLKWLRGEALFSRGDVDRVPEKPTPVRHDRAQSLPSLDDRKTMLRGARLRAESSPNPPRWCSRDDASILSDPLLWLLATEWMSSHTVASPTRIEVIRNETSHPAPSTNSSLSFGESSSNDSFTSSGGSSYSDSSGAGGTL